MHRLEEESTDMERQRPEKTIYEASPAVDPRKAYLSTVHSLFKQTNDQLKLPSHLTQEVKKRTIIAWVAVSMERDDVLQKMLRKGIYLPYEDTVLTDDKRLMKLNLLEVAACFWTDTKSHKYLTMILDLLAYNVPLKTYIITEEMQAGVAALILSLRESDPERHRSLLSSIVNDKKSSLSNCVRYKHGFLDPDLENLWNPLHCLHKTHYELPVQQPQSQDGDYVALQEIVANKVAR